ncbi:MAG: lipocalin family protein [Bdellovibrionaceae bacterium]|nr:lipocalin family protein [Bdellovibrionales bacterium]MCB9254469.1 lipocalin family protein [Pseudobdellovibrionaceae bacterium]
MIRIFILSLFLLPASGLAANFSDKEPIELKKYLGLWYELARTPNDNQDNTPTIDGKKFSICYETTATYSSGDEGYVNIRNVCNRYAEDGTRFEDAITGAAKIFEDPTQRKLGIAFGSGFAQFFQRLISGGGFDYWIYQVGPETPEGLYSWALVSGESRNYLFVLGRTPTLSAGEKAKILKAAEEEGLPVSKLVFVQQYPKK